ncbi:MAG: tetratricopeptide repeat protein [Candidatus Thorarchaeota archaeon]
MATSEELLREAVRFHQSSEFKKGINSAEKARKQFLKERNPARATEALRVMADCTINARDLKKAKGLYELLLNEARSVSNSFYEAAAYWGIGQVYSHQMNYQEAAKAFAAGLTAARKIADKWYTGWNAFGIGNATRGMGHLADAKPYYNEAIEAFQGMDQAALASWAERALKEIGGERVETLPADVKIWLCPMCGSKFGTSETELIKKGKVVTCSYCGTTIG